MVIEYPRIGFGSCLVDWIAPIRILGLVPQEDGLAQGWESMFPIIIFLKMIWDLFLDYLECPGVSEDK